MIIRRPLSVSLFPYTTLFRSYYDAVIFATGAIRDAELNIPGVELEGSHGAADFVSWYDGHPDVPRTWPLDAKQVAVFGAGRSEEHTSELQSRGHLVCRLLLEK